MVLQDRDEMVRYVTEEVDRVRDLFQAKEHKLSVDRDAAKEEVAASMKQCSSLNEELTSLKRPASGSQGREQCKCCGHGNSMLVLCMRLQSPFRVHGAICSMTASSSCPA